MPRNVEIKARLHNIEELRARAAALSDCAPEVIEQSLHYARPGATLVLFTPTAAGVRTSLDLGDLYFREIRLVPSYSCGPDDTRLAYKLLREGQVPAERLVTHRFALGEVQAAYDTARDGGDALKVLVTFAKDVPDAEK